MHLASCEESKQVAQNLPLGGPTPLRSASEPGFECKTQSERVKYNTEFGELAATVGGLTTTTAQAEALGGGTESVVGQIHHIPDLLSWRGMPTVDKIGPARSLVSFAASLQMPCGGRW